MLDINWAVGALVRNPDCHCGGLCCSPSQRSCAYRPVLLQARWDGTALLSSPRSMRLLSLGRGLLVLAVAPNHVDSPTHSSPIPHMLASALSLHTLFALIGESPEVKAGSDLLV